MRLSFVSILLQFFIAFLVVDILGGVFHWFEDTYLDYCVDVPFISEIAKDNELHHYFPRTIVAYSYLENMKKTVIILSVILLILYLVFRKSIFKYPFFLASFLFWSCTINVFHRFSHMRECENHFIITSLQKTGLLCSHEHHSVHHKTVDSKYCVLSEYTNHLLDSIYFWRILESIIFICTGIKPDRKPPYDDYAEIQNYMHENAKLECPDRPTVKDIDILKIKLKEYKKCKNHANHKNQANRKNA